MSIYTPWFKLARFIPTLTFISCDIKILEIDIRMFFVMYVGCKQSMDIFLGVNFFRDLFHLFFYFEPNCYRAGGQAIQ